MGANYKLVRNPNPHQTDEQQPLHPRLVSNGTISTDGLINRAQAISSFSSADIKGMLQLVQDVMADYLLSGYNIELEGIGTFSIALQSRQVMDKKEIRGESVHFKDVLYRSSKELRERLKTMPVYRSETEVSDPTYLTPLQCEENLAWYLEHHPYITSKEYTTLCYCKKTKAAEDLKRFAQQGTLRVERLGSARLYYKAENTDTAAEPKAE